MLEELRIVNSSLGWTEEHARDKFPGFFALLCNSSTVPNLRAFDMSYCADSTEEAKVLCSCLRHGLSENNHSTRRYPLRVTIGGVRNDWKIQEEIASWPVEKSIEFIIRPDLMHWL